MICQRRPGLQRPIEGIALAIALAILLCAIGCGGGKVILTPTATLSATPTGILTPVSSPTAGLGTIVYIVKPGDTLSDIADQFGTTVEAIVQANDIKDPDSIKEGQELIIPKK